MMLIDVPAPADETPSERRPIWKVILTLGGLAAMSGLPVPAAEGTIIPFLDSLHVLIGDDQRPQPNPLRRRGDTRSHALPGCSLQSDLHLRVVLQIQEPRRGPVVTAAGCHHDQGRSVLHGRGEQHRVGPTTSASNCGEFEHRHV